MQDIEFEKQEKIWKKNSEVRNGNTFWKIDKNMLPYKIHFFLYIGAMGSLLPFHPSIGITRLGLGAGDLALVFTVQQFLFIVLKPLIGYIVDYFNNLKAMIVILTVLNAILSYLLLAIPQIDNQSMKIWKESQLVNEESSFCEFCQSISNVQRVVDALPKSIDLFEEAVSCKDKNNTFHRTFFYHCDEKGNSSLSSFNSVYNIIFKSCSLSNNPNKTYVTSKFHKTYDDILYISMTKYPNISQFTVACPRIKYFTQLNFTVEHLAESCYSSFHKESDALKSIIIATPDVTTKFCNTAGSADNKINRIPKVDTFQTYQFWLFTLFILISCASTSCIFTLSDTACYENIQDTGADYGKQRAWGAIGWGLMAPFAGFLNDFTDSYLAAMVLMTVLCALQIWNLSKMSIVKPQFSENILKNIRSVFSSVEFIAFEFAVLMNGMGIGIVWFFLAWFITDIGGTRLLIGLAHTVQCFFGEVPFMFFSGWLLRRLGHFNVVSLALFCHCVRFLSYSYLSNPWFILPIECLDGITFGAFYAAMTSYGKLSAKPGTEATTQSLLCSTYEGLGAGLGCVISGICFDYYGGHTTFFYAGLCFGAATAINLTFTIILRCKKGSLKISEENICDNEV